MKTTTIRLGSRETPRFDAGFHLSDGVRARSAMERCPYECLRVSSVTQDIFFGGRDKRVYVHDARHGHPFLSASGMLKSDLSSLKLISKKLTPNFESTLVRKGWIFVSRSGTVGRCVFANGMHDGLSASEDVIRVVPNDRISVGCLYAFFASKYGYALLTQGTFGSVIDHVEPNYIKSLPVPVFPDNLQRKVHERIIESARLREEADAALKRAVALFERESRQEGLGQKCRTGVATIGRIVAMSKRFDAHYQIGTQLLDAEKNNNGAEQVSLAGVAKRIFVGSRGKRNYVKRGIPFLSSSDMMLFNAIRESKPISKYNPGLDSLLVHENDILISRSGTVGSVIIVGHDLDNCAVSEHALRLVVDEAKISPLYVFCYLKTSHAKSYMESSAYGSVIITLNETFVGAMTMSVFKGKVYDSIVADIGEYKDKLAGAADLENEAIDMVEREIESWQEDD